MKNFTSVRCDGGGGMRTRRTRPRACAAAAIVAAVLQGPACGGDRDIEKPTPLFTESPVEYPLELWDQDVEGNTLVRVLVNEEGGVDSVEVQESSGHAALDSAAVKGALTMLFEPARKEGEPLRVWARVPVYFSKDVRPADVVRPPAPETGNTARSSRENPDVTQGTRGLPGSRG